MTRIYILAALIVATGSFITYTRWDAAQDAIRDHNARVNEQRLETIQDDKERDNEVDGFSDDDLRDAANQWLHPNGSR